MRSGAFGAADGHRPVSLWTKVRGATRGASKVAVRGLVFLIQMYRHMVSPLRPATCRFVPTCSQYAVEALMEYGLIRGSWLAAFRLAKCGPWHRGGWDPIPERRACRTTCEDAVSGSTAKQRESETFV